MTLHPQPLPPCPTPSQADYVATTVYYAVLVLLAPGGALAFRRWRRDGARMRTPARTALFVAWVLCALFWADSFALGLVYALAPVCRL